MTRPAREKRCRHERPEQIKAYGLGKVEYVGQWCDECGSLKIGWSGRWRLPKRKSVVASEEEEK